VQDLLPVYEVESADPLAKRMGVSSYPTIFFSAPWATFKFEGSRTPEEIRRFVLQKMGQYLILANLARKIMAGGAGQGRI